VDEGDTFYGPVNLAVCVIGSHQGICEVLIFAVLQRHATRHWTAARRVRQQKPA
jgi:hypothetical protein